MKIKEREKAKTLRAKGYSIKEISDILSVSKASTSVWVRGIVLSDIANKRIQELKDNGQQKAQSVLINKKLKRLNESLNKAKKILDQINHDSNWEKIVCALIYWCEGVKEDSILAFTNSDPNLVKTFLRLLRNNFTIVEDKLRVCVHLHEYHNKEKQIRFWSHVTGIATSQFIKPYFKKNGAKNIRKNYQGCVSIRYYNARMAQELNAIARVYMGL